MGTITNMPLLLKTVGKVALLGKFIQSFEQFLDIANSMYCLVKSESYLAYLQVASSIDNLVAAVAY